MDVDTSLCAAFTIALIAIVVKRLNQKRRNRRRFKIRPINRKRNERGGFKYFQDMKQNDPELFFKYTRMTIPMFDNLLKLVSKPLRRRRITHGISPEQRLAITLQYLSQGGSMQTFAWNFQIGLTTVSKIIEETCEAIWQCLHKKYLKNPGKDDFREISQSFWQKWNFPNCLGAIDGKHIYIQAPANSGSVFFNYKKSFSIVLLAVCDANYLFTLVDIGGYGSQSDGGIFKNSTFGQKFENGSMPIAEPTNLPGSQVRIPFVLVRDQPFPLKNYLFRPYPGSTNNLSEQQKIFNYRLSRCRRVIENAFGILVARWRIFKGTIIASPEHIDLFIKTCVVLHRYCKIESFMNNSQSGYCPPGFTDTGDEDNGQWRNEVQPLESLTRTGSNNASRYLFNLRDKLASYFVNIRPLPWQVERVRMGQQPIFPRPI